MYKTILFIFLSTLSVVAFEQPANTLNYSTSVQIKNYTALSDHGYPFEKILADTTLPFVINDSLRLFKATSFWLKIIIVNPYQYAEQYSLWVQPELTNTLYYFDANAQKWVSKQAGILSPTDKSRNQGWMPFMMQAKTKNMLYVKVDLSQPQKIQQYAIKPLIYLKKQTTIHQYEQVMWVSWLVAIVVLLIFILNNLYIYLSYKDKTVLYYLISLLGGVIYVTSNKQFFHTLLPFKIFTAQLQPNGILNYYNIDDLLNHISVLIIVYGTVQMTRFYLGTKKMLPKLDALLKKGLFVYLLATVALAIINTCFFFVNTYTLAYENLLVLLIFTVIICTCVVAYQRKLPSAGSFLLANLLPLCIILAIALYHVLVSSKDTWSLLMPDLAVSSQAIAFSIALVARINLIRSDLATKEMEAQQLAFDIQKIEFQHQLLELENQKINADILHEKNRNELLTLTLTNNQRELAANAIYTVQKNEMLAKLKAEIADLKKLYPARKHQQLAGMEKILQINLDLDDDWHKFKFHFEQVNPNFFEQLLAKHPGLTKNDMRLCAYFHINLSTKEIAAMLNITPASVRQAKMRLYKKIGKENLPDDE